MDDNKLAKLPQDSSALSADPQGRRTELEISGNEVYLPASTVVKPGDDRYRELVKDALPPEIGSSISEEVLGRPKGYSAGGVLLILAFLCAYVAIFWWLIPRPVPLGSTDISIPPPERQKIYRGRFSTQFERAQNQINEKKYIAAKETLRPLVKKLLSGKALSAADDLIFFTYFDLLHSHLGWDDKSDYGLLGQLRDKCPDEFRWQLFHILNSPVLKIRDGHLQTPGHNIGTNAEQILDRMKIIDDLRVRHHDDKKLVEQLDLYKCYLDLYLWRIKNAKDPDDSKGQEDREEALKIALRYKGNGDFIQARRYIIQQMLNDGTSGYYRFNGEKHYWSTYLKDALEELNKEAKEGGKKK